MKPQEYSLTLTPGLTSATRATHIETDITTLPADNRQMTVRLQGSELQTMRLVPAKAVAP